MNRITHLAVAIGAFAVGTLHAATYVLSAANWGQAQVNAVTAAGGTVRFAHDGAGIAVAQSNEANFLAKALRGGAIASGAVDKTVQWQAPLASDEATFIEHAVLPQNDTLYGFQWAPKAIEAPAAWALGFTGVA